jgi:tetratricopeptide (TPR) repeat protein
MPTFHSHGVQRPWQRSHAFAAYLLTLGLLSGCNIDALQSAAEIKSAARQSLEQRNFADAVKQALRLAEKTPDDADAHYLLAQAQTQSGDRTAAVVSLERAIRRGLTDDREIDRNPGLEPLRAMSAYADLMSTSFPERARTLRATAGAVSVSVGGVTTSTGVEAATDSAVRIDASSDKQVVRAGDVVIELPNAK